MPIIIAIVVVVVGAVAFTLVQSTPATEPETITTTEEVRPPEEESNSAEATGDASIAAESQIEVSTEEPDLSTVSEVVEDVRPSDSDLTTYVDGTYTVQTSYFTPRRTEHIMDVSLTLENDIVTATEIVWDGDVEPKTPSHTGFDEAYEAEVVGQPLNEIFLSRVGGASLTSEAFNEAIETIELEASAS